MPYSDKLNELIIEEDKLRNINLNVPNDEYVSSELEKVRSKIHELKMEEDPNYKKSVEGKPEPDIIG